MDDSTTHRPLRVCADTSVSGGAHDDEFSDLSAPFFERVREGAIRHVISVVVLEELKGAPEGVRNFFDKLFPYVERVNISKEAYALREAYMRANVVGPKWQADALHVAVATVSGCRAIVSWNFKHIVNYRRIPLYNGVNQMEGYGPMAIHTPPEMISDEED